MIGRARQAEGIVQRTAVEGAWEGGSKQQEEEREKQRGGELKKASLRLVVNLRSPAPPEHPNPEIAQNKFQDPESTTFPSTRANALHPPLRLKAKTANQLVTAPHSAQSREIALRVTPPNAAIKRQPTSSFSRRGFVWTECSVLRTPVEQSKELPLRHPFGTDIPRDSKYSVPYSALLSVIRCLQSHETWLSTLSAAKSQKHLKMRNTKQRRQGFGCHRRKYTKPFKDWIGNNVGLLKT
ncbi:hypothetical protein CIHG_03745 [Coccidioides immitis H538.4]|uniref:Uncharacterized protein n=1 Tax=Coccidioides immitis H538.4 TaxID=396776 RepID=A0A0J8RKP8_COCIT|nr:hypothetical protein CIHG_03745 [Coccidioides immitis H538.4]